MDHTGSAHRMTHDGTGGLVEGENLELDPLVQSFRVVWDDDIAAPGTSQVTWEIEQVADSCRLVVRHDQQAADEHLFGWPTVLPVPKTWPETGTELTTPGSLRYGGKPSRPPAGHV
ncbi:hypothetical protein GCM10022222_26830 [Amycolatopsis ultiminotia]|uniref:Uncharacterized protein n=1 Tax=Amycolatopsis ultiminotia TaxID=543629 RepID=A0ABP6VYF0_9PSEU